MFHKKGVEKIATHILCSVTLFRKSRRLWDVEKILQSAAGHRWQYDACALHSGYLSSHTHTGCVMLIAFPQQQWSHECAPCYIYTYTTCLVTSYSALYNDYRGALSTTVKRTERETNHSPPTSAETETVWSNTLNPLPNNCTYTQTTLL